MSRPVLPRPCLVVITDQERSALPLVEALAQAVTAGVDLVQVRAPGLGHEDLVVLAREVRSLVAGRALLVVNGGIEAALAAGADGVHLPEDGPSVTEVRARGGERLLVGRSVHSAPAAQDAEAEGADYVQVGSIFPTRSHPGAPVGGLALLRAVCAAVQLPILAVGGITSENAADVLAAGADGVAVIDAVLGSREPGTAVRRLRAAIQTRGERPGERPGERHATAHQ